MRSLNRQPSRREIGDILLSEGMITGQQLEEALEAQKTDKRYIGKILVSLGYITHDDLARALGMHLNVEYVALSEIEVDPEILGIISEDVLLRHKAVPLRVEDGRMLVAMSNPNDVHARSDLATSAGYPVTPVVAAEDAVLHLQEQLFEQGRGEERQPETGSLREEGRRGAGSGRIGDILVSEGKITERQLEQALAMQRYDPQDLGKILLSLGFVVPADVAQALAKRLKLDYVVISDLSEDEVDPAALNLIGAETMRKYKALLLHFESGRLVVAMSDPNDIYALEDLRIITKHPITPVVATEEDLQDAFTRLFCTKDPHSEVSEEPVGGSIEEPVQADLAGVELAQPADGLPARAEESRGKKVAIGSAKIGDILVSEGIITEQQLKQALEAQRYDPREIGKILLSFGYVNKLDLAQALAKRLRLDFVELTERNVDRSVASLVEQRVLRRYGVMPLRLENGRFVVAMSDPTNVHALEDLMMISGYPVTPVVALEEDIRRVHDKAFAMSEEVSEFLEEAGRQTVEQDYGELELGREASPDEAPIIRLVSSILRQAVGDGASDVHVEPQARQLAVRIRVDGVLREAMSIPPKLKSGVIARLKVVGNLDIAERRVPQDGRFSVTLGGRKIDLRVASLPTVYGEKVVLRLLDTSNAAVDLAKLGFHPKVYEKYQEIFRRPYGTILITGPTGSGKSTTLYATLNELNSPEKNIITVEDPVEYRMRGVNQIQTNPKAGLTFASALRSILRADPDIMMIGEIRDFETAKIAVEAALTGHLVLATLHTNDAPGALSRLTDMGVETFLTSSAIDCVIAQRLARRLCARCKEPVTLEKEILAGIGFPFEHVSEEGLRFHKAVGCDRCGGSGYRGRIGIFELMVVTDKIKEMILRSVSTGEIGRAAGEEGMVRLRSDGLLKAAEGLTTVEEILRTVV